MLQNPRAVTGLVFSMDQTAIHDGPGVRMNVYLKGCPLRCAWCHSPESQSPRPEVVWYETKCSRCGRCVDVCPEGLRTFDLINKEDRARCRLCGACVQACPNGALEIKGRSMRAGEIVDEAVRLKPFFHRTGGGLTLTGGEPTAQPRFAFAVASLCRGEGIHVALETCGFVEWRVLARLARVIDLFLYDLKLAEDRRHRQYAGVPNRRILNNLQRLADAGADIIVRVPLIPTVNDDPSSVKAIGRRVLDAGLTRVTLLPFNPATAGKYSWVRRELPLGETVRQSPAYVETLHRALGEEGLEIVPA